MGSILTDIFLGGLKGGGDIKTEPLKEAESKTDYTAIIILIVILLLAVGFFVYYKKSN